MWNCTTDIRKYINVGEYNKVYMCMYIRYFDHKDAICI